MTDLLCILLLAFQFAFLVRLVLGFFPVRMGSPAASALTLTTSITEPVLRPIRQAVPPLPGMMAGIGIAEIALLLILIVLTGIIC